MPPGCPVNGNRDLERFCSSFGYQTADGRPDRHSFRNSWCSAAQRNHSNGWLIGAGYKLGELKIYKMSASEDTRGKRVERPRANVLNGMSHYHTCPMRLNNLSLLAWSEVTTRSHLQ